MRRTYFAIGIAAGIALGIIAQDVAIGIGCSLAIGVLFASDGEIKR
ncbi:MAG: hypothetical protein JKY70_05085 [Mucilaginibacter sp.]|nr:hypothetical protein [Mucilaginibacter sp.]